MKDTIIALLREVPADTLVIRYISRSYTAAEMIAELEKDTDAGKMWASELLRVSRDLLARQAVKVTTEA